MIQTNAKGRELQISMPGSEGEYIALMQALVIGIMSISESSEQYNDAQKSLGLLLLEILPGEENIVLKKVKTGNHE